MSVEYHNKLKGQKPGVGGRGPFATGHVTAPQVDKSGLVAFLQSTAPRGSALFPGGNPCVLGKTTVGDESLRCSSDFLFSSMSDRTFAFCDLIFC